MTVLAEIIAATRRRVAECRSTAKMQELERRAEAHVPRGFRKALETASAGGPAVIAELKKASPSRGVIRSDFNAAALAKELTQAGATALSVLTDEEYFQGSLENLRAASQSAPLPCLRKDFIVDEFQILEARAHHADAILLILAALDDAEFRSLLDRAESMDLDVLCEVHNMEELKRALEGGADVIGVNSRDLKTFHVNLDTLIEMAESIPNHVLRIAESGIDKGSDIRELHTAGYQAFLIGETLMRAEDPGQQLQQLLHDAGWYSPSASSSPNWRGTVQ